MSGMEQDGKGGRRCVERGRTIRKTKTKGRKGRKNGKVRKV